MVSPEPALAGDLSAAPTVVVTGAAGWLGQNLVRALAARPRARPLPRAAADEAPLLEVVGPPIEVVVGDVRDPAVIDALFEGVGARTVFHAAAVIHPAQHASASSSTSTSAARSSCSTGRGASARARFVHVSSNSPFGANATPDRPLRRGLAVQPVHGLRPLEARSRAARAAQLRARRPRRP